MDPLTTWKEVCTSLKSSQWKEAMEHIYTLMDWYDKGGYQVDNISTFFLQDLLYLIRMKIWEVKR